MIKLSILIRTIVGREASFNSLINSLLEQGTFIQLKDGWTDPHTGVEILFHKDNKEISVGAKAQLLIERAVGKFVCFIDDDDSSPPYYIDEILTAIDNNHNLDCIGFQILCNGTSRNGNTELASASNRWNDWAENIGGFRYVRTIYHKSPVRREHALAIGYKDLRFGEDHDYSKRLKMSGLLKQETYIDKIMYYYNYKYQEPKIKYGF